MVTTYRMTYDHQVTVNFLDEYKATKAFLESDWRMFFKKVDTLDQVKQHLAITFFETNAETTRFNAIVKHVKGFGTLTKQENQWVLTNYRGHDSDFPCGDISVSYQKVLVAKEI